MAHSVRHNVRCVSLTYAASISRSTSESRCLLRFNVEIIRPYLICRCIFCRDIRPLCRHRVMASLCVDPIPRRRRRRRLQIVNLNEKYSLADAIFTVCRQDARTPSGSIGDSLTRRYRSTNAFNIVAKQLNVTLRQIPLVGSRDDVMQMWTELPNWNHWHRV